MKKRPVIEDVRKLVEFKPPRILVPPLRIEEKPWDWEINQVLVDAGYELQGEVNGTKIYELLRN